MTGKNTGNPDWDYCYEVLDSLNDLEKNCYERNELKRECLKKVNRRRDLIAVCLAAIIPVILWGYYLGSGAFMYSGGSEGTDLTSFTTRTLGILMITGLVFIGVHLLFGYFWKKKFLAPLKSKIETNVMVSFQGKWDVNHEQCKEILERDVIKNSLIPDTYLSTHMIFLILHYFENNQIEFLDIAIFMLEQDLENTKHSETLVPTETLVQKEREYLKNHRIGSLIDYKDLN